MELPTSSVSILSARTPCFSTRITSTAGTFLPLAFQPFGYPRVRTSSTPTRSKSNLTIERDLGNGYAFSLAYNFNGGRHLNRPINANAVRGDLLVANWQAALATRLGNYVAGPLQVGTGCNPGRDLKRPSTPLRRLPR